MPDRDVWGAGGLAATDQSVARGACRRREPVIANERQNRRARSLTDLDAAWPKAEAANTRALELDDRLAEAYTGLAALRLVCYRDWAGAERAVRRGIEQNPNFDEIHYFHSFYLLTSGRFDDAIASGRRALTIDPFSPRMNQHLAGCFYYARRYDEAIRHYRQTLEFEANNVSAREALGDAFERKGMHGEAVAEWRAAMALAGDEVLGAALASGWVIMCPLPNSPMSTRGSEIGNAHFIFWTARATSATCTP